MFSILNGVSIGRDAFVTVVNLYNMNSFCWKLCKRIGQGDPEKCKSLCIYCSNVLLTTDLNEFKQKKVNHICKTKKQQICFRKEKLQY